MTDDVMPQPSLGPLAAALAKAQAEFDPLVRSKTVRVDLKNGGSYTFKYAPLDTLLNLVRKPLSDNGLAISQLLDDGHLTTMLLHESGGSLIGRTVVPPSSNIQDLGSSITYLRRYAIQSLLGLAAEEDDDGNRSVGNRTETERETTQVGDETLELLGKVDVKGKAVQGGSALYKGDYRQTPDDEVAIGFKLTRPGADDKDIPQVLIVGEVATALGVADPGASFMDQSVHVKGRLYAVKVPGRRTFNRLVVGEAEGHFIATDEWRIPAAVPPSEPGPGEEAPDPAASIAPGQEEFDLSEEALAPVA